MMGVYRSAPGIFSPDKLRKLRQLNPNNSNGHGHDGHGHDAHKHHGPELSNGMQVATQMIDSFLSVQAKIQKLFEESNNKADERQYEEPMRSLPDGERIRHKAEDAFTRHKNLFGIMVNEMLSQANHNLTPGTAISQFEKMKVLAEKNEAKAGMITGAIIGASSGFGMGMELKAYHPFWQLFGKSGGMVPDGFKIAPLVAMASGAIIDRFSFLRTGKVRNPEMRNDRIDLSAFGIGKLTNREVGGAFAARFGKKQMAEDQRNKGIKIAESLQPPTRATIDQTLQKRQDDAQAEADRLAAEKQKVIDDKAEADRLAAEKQKVIDDKKEADRVAAELAIAEAARIAAEQQAEVARLKPVKDIEARFANAADPEVAKQTFDGLKKDVFTWEGFGGGDPVIFVDCNSRESLESMSNLAEKLIQIYKKTTARPIQFVLCINGGVARFTNASSPDASVEKAVGNLVNGKNGGIGLMAIDPFTGNPYSDFRIYEDKVSVVPQGRGINIPDIATMQDYARKYAKSMGWPEPKLFTEQI